MENLGAHDANMLLMSLLILQTEVGLNVTSKDRMFRSESGESMGQQMSRSDSLGAYWEERGPRTSRLLNSTPLSRRKKSSRKAFQIRKHLLHRTSEPSDAEDVNGQDRAPCSGARRVWAAACFSSHINCHWIYFCGFAFCRGVFGFSSCASVVFILCCSSPFSNILH